MVLEGWLAGGVYIEILSNKDNAAQYCQNVHAIGDRANGIVLDSLEAALSGVNVSALRPRLEHAQIMTYVDIKRVGKIGGTLLF